MLRLERRQKPSGLLVFAAPLLALLIAAALIAGLLQALDHDPWQGLQVFFVAPFSSAYGLSELCMKAVPLTLIALGLMICFRANLWNIGAEGQFILGAVCASGVALRADQTTSPAIIWLILLAGIGGGMAWAAITAWLKDRWHSSEILVSFMLVYVAISLLNYLVYGPWQDPDGYGFAQTKVFAAATQLPLVFDGLRINFGVLVALVAVLATYLFLNRSLTGFALRVNGLAPVAARYAGFSRRQTLWIALLISGGAAGLAGGLEAIGPLGQLTPQLPLGYGFAAIIVVFVGRLQPLGIVLAALLLAALLIGGELAQSRLGLPKALSSIFQGLLLLALLSCDALIHYRLCWRRA